jgi:hypothetical protein
MTAWYQLNSWSLYLMVSMEYFVTVTAWYQPNSWSLYLMVSREFFVTVTVWYTLLYRHHQIK